MLATTFLNGAFTTNQKVISEQSARECIKINEGVIESHEKLEIYSLRTTAYLSIVTTKKRKHLSPSSAQIA